MRLRALCSRAARIAKSDSWVSRLAALAPAAVRVLAGPEHRTPVETVSRKARCARAHQLAIDRSGLERC